MSDKQPMNFWEWLDRNGEGLCFYLIVLVLIIAHIIKSY